jgi:hypothetical protein
MKPFAGPGLNREILPTLVRREMIQRWSWLARQTAHQERWNHTLRQRLGRYPPKSLSFSKEDGFHTYCVTTTIDVIEYMFQF